MSSEDQKEKKNSFLDRSLDFIFSEDSRKWLIAIFLFGLVLRIIVASNVVPVADEMVHGVHAIGLSKLAPLGTMTQGPVWYYLTDYGYRLFGVHLLTARLLSVVFGSLTILLAYMIGNLAFNRKTGLVAAFLLAISAYHIHWAASYQDQAMMFFILLASFFFIKEYKEKKQISVVSSIFLGVAILIKIITGAFMIVFGAFMIWILYKNFKTDKKMFRTNLKRTFIFSGIILLSLLPIVTYDYLLYKEKGIVDLPFAQFLRLNAEFYTGPGLAHEEGFVLNKLPVNLYNVITVYFIREDLLLFLTGLLGIIYLVSKLKKIKFEELFLISMFIFTLLFIASAIVLQTHYTSFMPLLAIFGASVLINGLEKYKLNTNKIIYGVLITILLLNIYNIREPLTSKSSIDKLRTYSEGIDQNTLVLVDSRIYTGTYVWALQNTKYIDASHLSKLMEISNSTGNSASIKTIFVECVSDDCGWGTIKDQPELNASMEMLVSQFRSISQVTDINGGGSITGIRGAEIAGEPALRIYKASVKLDPLVLQLVDQTHSHFFYHIPRDADPKNAFDYYPVRGMVDNLLNSIAYAILYAFIGIAILSMLIPAYNIIKER